MSQFENYLNLILDWNQTINLTGSKTTEDLKRHIDDCLSVLPIIHELKKTAILDVGTGAGLPGVVLAIADPNLKITLLDSNNKKISFLRHVQAQLKLTNCEIINSRVEDFAGSYPLIISRAFASPEKFIASCRHLCAVDGKIMAMQGSIEQAQLLSLQSNSSVVVQQLTVPGWEQRCVAIFNPRGLKR